MPVDQAELRTDVMGREATRLILDRISGRVQGPPLVIKVSSTLSNLNDIV